MFEEGGHEDETAEPYLEAFSTEIKYDCRDLFAYK
jgi:hypothetical protein